MGKAIVSIIMGSDSDLPIMQEAVKILGELGIPHEYTIISAHRTPEKIFEFASGLGDRGIEIVIAGAGGAAHLAGVTAALTLLPVIGVPIESKSLGGVDSLYSTVQMPSGIPVATVAINGAKNAGLLAGQILALKDEKVRKRLEDYRKNLKKEVEGKASKLQSLGYKSYLSNMK